MTQALIYLGIFLATLAVMECVAWATHKYILHGILWPLHRSHHDGHNGVFAGSDLLGFIFSTLAIVLLLLGLYAAWPWFFAGLGLVCYGVIHLFMHDILVHHRFGLRITPRGDYLQRMYQAHRLHHAVAEREGAVSFGFLMAPSIAALKEQLRMNRARGAAVDESEVQTSHDWTTG